MSRRRFIGSLRAIAVFTSLMGGLADPVLAASTVAEVDGLRQQFPVGSIDSVARADAALASTAGAKERVVKDYKAAARECIKAILVNDCLERARALQQKRLADIDAVELDANRFKRRDHSDKLEADRTQREAERQARASADAEQRAKNRKTFDDKQTQSARDVADRKKSDERRAKAPPRKAGAKSPPPGVPEIAAAQRAKNATDYANKVKEVKEHENAIQRNLASKAADRKHRADAKAAKEAAAPRSAPPPAPLAAVPKP